jgi:uncharacterized protein (TIGR02145 family)/uncharacterized repeat protein (TIGR02543 family)
MKKKYTFFIATLACIFFFTGCKKDEYVVTFNPNGGRGDLVTQNFTHKVAQSLMANPFTNRGFVFTGWNTASNGTGTAYKDEESVKITSHVVLYAQWRIATGFFTVTFDANGAIGEMSPQIFTAGEAQALSPNAFYYENYRFTGWNTSPNGKGKDYTNEQNITISSNITLYAQWVPRTNTYFVMFDANGGVGEMEPQTFKGDDYISLKPNTFTRDGYLYKGWNTKADGTGSFFKDEASIYVSSNIVLYALWINPDGGGVPCPSAPTVKDVDNNTYNTVQIGSQCWMKENLRTTKYRTGVNIPVVTDNVDWSYYTTSGAMCYYNNEVTNAAIYGALYNAYAVNTNNLCPTGWHVPSNEEWNALVSELGNIAGYKMKTAMGWDDYWGDDGNGNNESGFSALPAGYRDYYFYNLKIMTCFWTSTNYSYAQEYRTLSSSSSLLNSSAVSLDYGFSVRCIKD